MLLFAGKNITGLFSYNFLSLSENDSSDWKGNLKQVRMKIEKQTRGNYLGDLVEDTFKKYGRYFQKVSG